MPETDAADLQSRGMYSSPNGSLALSVPRLAIRTTVGNHETTRDTGSEQPTRLLSFDADTIKDDFPILKQSVYDKPLVYLDSAATSQKPRAVIDAIAHYYSTDNSNIHRGVHLLSERATQQYEEARVDVQRYINAAQSKEIIFVRGTTEAINLVANSFGRANVNAGDEV